MTPEDIAIEEQEKQRVFKQLLNLETRIISIASKYGRGVKLNETQRRKYYKQVTKQARLQAMLKAKGWDLEYNQIGLG